MSTDAPHHRLSPKAITVAVRRAIAEDEPEDVVIPYSALPQLSATATRRARSCAAQHFGPWAILPRWMGAAVQAVKSGAWASYGDDDAASEDYGSYELTESGVAVIRIDGQMAKQQSSFGGCSTVETKSALRQAARNPETRAILLVIDSPGGTVAGNSELAAEIRRIRAEGLAVYAHVDDMCCSAAYWVASQCTWITAGPASLIGSIGTLCVLEDTSGADAQQGIKYHVVSTAAYKGLGADGVVDDLLLADVQREVEELNQPFLADVANGRKTDAQTVATWADGRCHAAAQALQLGLIDAVATLDDALEFAAPNDEVFQMAQTPTLPGARAVAAAVNGPKAPAVANAPATPAPAAPATPPAAPAAADPVIDTESADYKAGYDKGYADGQAAGPATPAEGSAPAAPAPAAAPGASSLTALVTACDGDKAAAMAYAMAGMTPAMAKAAYSEVKAMKADHARQLFEAGGQQPVAGAAGKQQTAAPADPDAQFKADWLANKDGCQQAYAGESTYIRVRRRNG